MSACPIYDGQEIDDGPDCCDLSCVWETEPLTWDGDNA